MAKQYFPAIHGWDNPRSGIVKKCASDGAVQSYSGQYRLGLTVFLFSLNRQNTKSSGYYSWRGTMRILDTKGHTLKMQGDLRRKTEAKWQAKREDLDAQYQGHIPKEVLTKFECRHSAALNACMALHCNQDTEEEIRGYLAKCAAALCTKHMDAIRQDLMQDGNLMKKSTLIFAWLMYGDRFLLGLSSGSPSQRKQVAAGVERVAYALSRLPMAKVTAAMVKKYAADRGNSKAVLTDLGYAQKFWVFCLQNKLCTGDNPIAEYLGRLGKRAPVDAEAAFRSAAQQAVLTEEEERRLNQYLEENWDAPLTRAILLSKEAGVEVKELAEMKLGDLEFQREPLRVYFHRTREYAGSATQNYTVPLSPYCAWLLTRWRDALEKGSDQWHQENVYVCGDWKTPASCKAINNGCLCVLRKLGIYRDTPGQRQIPALRLLQSNFHHRLLTYCGLRDEPGMVNFILGRAMSSDTTSDHYRSFTDPYGQELIYRALARDRRFFCDLPPELSGEGVFPAEEPDKRNFLQLVVRAEDDSNFNVCCATGMQISVTRKT